MSETWQTAAEVRATGKRVPPSVADLDLVRYIQDVDPDGDPVERMRVRRAPISAETEAERELCGWLVAWGRAVRTRYECGLPAECGGRCHLWIKHQGRCLCDGVEGGEEMCPA